MSGQPALTELMQALEAYFEVIRLQASANPPPLGPVMSSLDALAEQSYPGADPMLQHYLERKSYQKALAFLKGELAEHRP